MLAEDSLNAPASSSPPARGTSYNNRHHRLQGRFIPACAGNILRLRSIRCVRPVHPRLRGEHPSANVAGTIISGSSPPARGTFILGILSVRADRFIPACAGNIVSTAFESICLTVHPRLRGEHSQTVFPTLSLTGSSPPARGTCTDLGTDRGTDRFIPACAGNIRNGLHVCVGWAVHPRLRGEHFLIFSDHLNPCGSSPPARGTCAKDILALDNSRFIPACAGNIFTGCGQCVRHPVHPRLRGEHTLKVCRRNATRGSSPPARGT